MFIEKKGKDEIKNVVIVTIGIIVAINIFGLNDSSNLNDNSSLIGKLINIITFGFFGTPVYIIPFVLICYGLLKLFKKWNNKYYYISKHVGFLILILSTFFQLIYFEQNNDTDFLTVSYNISMNKYIPSGGIIGGFIAKLLIPFAGYIGSSVVLFSLFLICIILVAKNIKKDLPVEYNEPKTKSEKNEKINKSNIVKPPLNLFKNKTQQIKKTKKSPNSKLHEMDKLSMILKNFKVDGKIIGEPIEGAAITRFAVKLNTGVKLSKLISISDDIALGMGANGKVRIAQIPGKETVGIEIPNVNKKIILFKDIITSKQFKDYDNGIVFGLGKDITGNIILSDLIEMPHLLIAGSTGSGKSICINNLICGILKKYTSKEVKMLLIDPKVVEFNIYNGIPHLIKPVITKPKEAIKGLEWIVEEMEKRYQLFADIGVRDIKGYNVKQSNKMHKILVIIDELADLMMVSTKDENVEDYICRLTQKARAAGIHLVVATQRPSTDVITGLIKSNIPSRIAFTVASQYDSKTILDKGGAEKLLGKGDMLYMPIGATEAIRVQGGFISDKEVEQIVEKAKNIRNNPEGLLEQAKLIIVKEKQVSLSLLQKELGIGYNRSKELIEEMENKKWLKKNSKDKFEVLLLTTSI